MDISVRAAQLSGLKTPLLALPAFGQLKKNPLIVALDKPLGGALSRLAKEEKFEGKSGQSLTLTPSEGLKATRLVVVGLGNPKDELATQVRTFAHRTARQVRDKGLKQFALAAPPAAVPTADVVQWLTEGARSGVYRYEELQTGDRKPEPSPKACVIVLPKDAAEKPPKVTADIKSGLHRGQAVAAGVELARDLVNRPSNILDPETLARRAEEVASELELDIDVLGPEQIEERGMGLLTAVGQGSAAEPRFVHLTYHPRVDTPRGTIALVGKGITFDSGGLSLKTGKGMIDMKCDMGGAATVLGALEAIARAELEYTVHGVIPMAENMPGQGAYRPGDVFTALNGKTVEVLNTDAEGRLILADALAFAADLAPDVIIDLATLTGACMVALGPYRAALFSSNDDWAERLEGAAARCGELFWQMPLAGELKESLKSSIADLKNIGGPWGGAITAALFLQEFVGDRPWMHLDIAGPAYLEKPRSASPKGGTGFGVPTLVEMLRSRD